MSSRYYIVMFMLCFTVWAVVVDNFILPSMNHLHQETGAYTRYRIKKWEKGGKLDVVEDELLIYAVVKNREQLYYMDYTPNFQFTLDRLPEQTPVKLRYVRAFPKLWKRELYDLRVDNRSVVAYSSYSMEQKQKKNWNITAIMLGIYGILVVLGLLNKRR